MAIIGTDISTAADHLRSDQLVAIPTETVYGLAANALSEAAVSAIFEAKGRPRTNPLIIHLPAAAALDPYIQNMPPAALRLANRFWPGPLTLLLPRLPKVPDIITAGLPSVAVRVPDHPMTLELLRRIDFPLAAPSANPFGYISPTRAEHVQNQLGEKIPYILDGGDCRKGLESTIVGFAGEEVIVHRLGAIPLEELREVAGEKLSFHTREANRPLSPGMLPYHYSPGTPLVLTDSLTESMKAYDPARTGILSINGFWQEVPVEQQVQLSPQGSLAEAGSRLYQSMHLLDALDLDVILVEKMPDYGLGRTMNDRLARAASK